MFKVTLFARARLIRILKVAATTCISPILLKSDPHLLDRVAQVRNLTAAEAAMNYPVHLRGVVTYYDPAEPDLFVQDASAGIYVFCKHPVAVDRGMRVELTGVSDPGDFAPVVVQPKVRAVGAGELPKASRVSFEQLLTGRLDSQLIEAEGTVKSVIILGRHLNLHVANGGDQIRLVVPNFPHEDLQHLVEARVRFQGVAGATYNGKRQLTGVLVFIQTFADLAFEESPNSSALQYPLRRPNELLQFSSAENIRQRVRVRGVVTLQQLGHALFLRDQDQSVMVLTRQAAVVQVGDQVEALGFPALGNFAPVLQDAVFRRIGSGTAPSPIHVTADEVLREGDYDTNLIALDGKLLSRTRDQGGEWLAVKSANRVINARLEGPANSSLATLQDYSFVRLTGICLVEAGGQGYQAQSFHMLMRSPADVTVLKKPGWWTLTHALWFVGLLAVVLLLAFGWVAILRREVQAQTSNLNTRNLELRQALEVAEIATHRAQVADKLKSEFLANMSHEIRTPMNAVIGMTELAMDTESREERKEYLADAADSAKSLLSLLNDILDFSKIEAGRIELDLCPFSIRECLAQVVRVVAVAAEKKGLQVTTGVEGDIPDQVVGDAMRLRQVVVNLFHNAVKFTDAGSIDLLAVREIGSPGTVIIHFSVRDTGPGIPNDKIDTIFEAFRQADGTITRKYGGTGLGLAICSRLVSLMGGRIWVESKLGAGSTFHFTALFQELTPEFETAATHADHGPFAVQA